MPFSAMLLVAIMAAAVVSGQALVPLLWQVKAAGAIGAPVFSADGALTLFTGSNQLWAVSSTNGSVVYQLPGTGSSLSAPGSSRDGRYVYLTSNDASVMAVRASDGFQIWTSWNIMPMTWDAPTVSGDVLVVLTGDGGATGLHRHTGAVLWHTKKGLFGPATTVAATASRMFLASRKASLTALSIRTGQIVWRIPLQTLFSPLVGDGGASVFQLQFLSDGDGPYANLSKINAATGAFIWNTTTYDYSFASPALGAQGVVIWPTWYGRELVTTTMTGWLSNGSVAFSSSFDFTSTPKYTATHSQNYVFGSYGSVLGGQVVNQTGELYFNQTWYATLPTGATSDHAPVIHEATGLLSTRDATGAMYGLRLP